MTLLKKLGSETGMPPHGSVTMRYLSEGVGYLFVFNHFRPGISSLERRQPQTLGCDFLDFDFPMVKKVRPLSGVQPVLKVLNAWLQQGFYDHEIRRQKTI